nr:MAG TPA: hypothetical protein [Caudoviricetes sp.]
MHVQIAITLTHYLYKKSNLILFRLWAWYFQTHNNNIISIY